MLINYIFVYRFCSSPAAVNFPHSFYEEPDGGGSGEGGGSAGEVQGMSVAAAVGSDEGVGMHLLRCAGRWAELTQGGPGARRMAAQMDKVCMEAGERAEVHETLLNLAQRCVSFARACTSSHSICVHLLSLYMRALPPHSMCTQVRSDER